MHSAGNFCNDSKRTPIQGNSVILRCRGFSRIAALAGLLLQVAANASAAQGNNVPVRSAGTDPTEQAGILDARLAAMSVLVTGSDPAEFVLRYHSEPIEFHGLLCYAFGGYNETCVNPRVLWLTRASRIRLPAPGGVPREFFPGYTALIRYPAMSTRQFRYPVRKTPGARNHE